MDYREVWQGRELERIDFETEEERRWWPLSDRFFTLQEADKAKEGGQLMDVPFVGDNYRLISVLSDGQGREPHLLRPEAFNLLVEALSLWRAQLGEGYERVRISVTSLYRDANLQTEMVKRGNALDPRSSSHLAGAAFDISARSYYIDKPHGEVQRIQQWNAQNGEFDFKVPEALKGVLEVFSSKGVCNFITENYFESPRRILPTVFHVCVRPSVAV